MLEDNKEELQNNVGGDKNSETTDPKTVSEKTTEIESDKIEKISTDISDDKEILNEIEETNAEDAEDAFEKEFQKPHMPGPLRTNMRWCYSWVLLSRPETIPRECCSTKRILNGRNSYFFLCLVGLKHVIGIRMIPCL